MFCKIKIITIHIHESYNATHYRIQYVHRLCWLVALLLTAHRDVAIFPAGVYISGEAPRTILVIVRISTVVVLRVKEAVVMTMGILLSPTLACPVAHCLASMPRIIKPNWIFHAAFI